MMRQNFTGDVTANTATRGRSVDPLETRYDQDTVTRAITLAAELEATYRETMTREQAEAIGEDVGVDPAFVRQALVHLEAEKNAARPQASPQQQTVTARQRQTPRQRPTLKKFVMGTALVTVSYAMFAYATYGASSDGATVLTVMFVLPFIIAAVIGAVGDSRPRGAVGGFAVVAATFAVCGLILSHDHEAPFQAGDSFGIALIFGGAGAVAGVIGAKIRRYIGSNS